MSLVVAFWLGAFYVWMAFQRDELVIKSEKFYQVQTDHKPVIKRAIMLIETAWMDIEPIPCEVEARNILKELLK